MKRMFLSSLVWAAIVALLGLNLVSGFVHDELYYRTLTPQEFDRVTGNGVVPGYWIVMPFVTLFVIVPVWLVGSGLTLLIVWAARKGGGNGNAQRGPAFLMSPWTASMLLAELGVISVAIQLVMALRR